MIEAMEQQIINSINNRWRKNREIRSEINIESVTESLRVICSSRNSTLAIINNLKSNNDFENSMLKLEENLEWIYNWVTCDCINSIYKRYKTHLKIKKIEEEYLKEIPEIELFLEDLKITVINNTIDKLIIFHGVNKGDN